MLVLSLTLGLFIDRIIREADTRAATIDELHRTQAELAAAERAQGVAGERERISREIHDTLAQGFTSVVTLARATELALDRGDLEAVRERLRADRADRRRQPLRGPAHRRRDDARPPAVAHPVRGAAAARRRRRRPRAGWRGRCASRGSRSSCRPTPRWCCCAPPRRGCPTCDGTRAPRLSRSSLSYAADGPVALVVTDDGVGFDPAAEARGYGLDGATARATEVGGRFDVDQQRRAQGRRLRVEVPR